ncbi:MAG: diacylglycerol kinase family lipid kinase [Melioribacteraceae bacterium]|nr:diacylglycerol kinase family lipid kinase [Melioribacteraceae bacterium]
MKKISFVINGLLKNINSRTKEIELLLGKDFNISYHISQRSTDSIDLSRKCIEEGTDYIIGIGGDGTLNEVINGVMLSDKKKRKNVKVGLLPTGSGNDFAKTMKLDSEVLTLKNLIESEQSVSIDIGKIECKDNNGNDAIRYFNNIADVGLGGEVVVKVNKSSKIFSPTFRYLKSSVEAFFTYRKKRIRFTSPHFVWEGAVLILCLANANYFGSGLGIAPHAQVDDGKMAVVIAGEISLFDYLRNLSRIRNKEIINHPGIIYKEVESCTIEPIEDNLLIETDGELAGILPLKMSVLNKEIEFLSPKK